MTDKKWLEEMRKCVYHLDMAFKKREIIEEEYKKRFGNYPSDVDDDYWIDSFHYNCGTIDLKKIIKEAKFSNEM